MPLERDTAALAALEPALAEYLRSRIGHERNLDPLEWIIKAAINLPAVLNEDFMAWLDSLTLDPVTLHGRPRDRCGDLVAR